MIAATFIGGTGDENPTGIALDPSGFVYISGFDDITEFAHHRRSRTKAAGIGHVSDRVCREVDE